MRKPMIWLGALLLTVTVHAQDFTRTLTAEEQAAAGLGKLSPAELAKLRTFVERYKAGAAAVAPEQAEQKVAATEAKAKAAEQKAAIAPAKAKDEETKPAASETKKRPSWLAALVTLKHAESKPDAEEAIETRLVGTLKNFSGRRSFTLENGQVWQMSEAGSYAGPAVEHPAVKVRPGAFGSFWLWIPEAAFSVKVKPVKLE